MRRVLVIVLPAAWLLTVAATPTTASSPATNPPTPTPTPRTGSLALDPTFGPPGTRVTVSGAQFVPGQQVQVYWDATDKVVGTVTADQSGAFKADLPVPDVAPGPHTVCSPQASVNATCANFRVEEKPAPSPSATAAPRPTPAVTDQPAATPLPIQPSPAAARLDAVGLLTRPPFVFFPILLVLAAIGAGAWIWWGRRPPPSPVRSAIVRHASTPTPAPRPLPPGGAAPVLSETRPAPAPEPVAEPPASPSRSAPGDESIDMPQPGD